MKILISLLVFSMVSSCTPFTKDLKGLDNAYASGQVSAETYYSSRAQLLAAQQAWGNSLAASINQASANMNSAAAVGAYNQRTAVLAQPQQVNVHHSGYVNQNVGGTLYLHQY